MKEHIINYCFTAGGGKSTKCREYLQQWRSEGIDPQRISYLTFMKRDVREALHHLSKHNGQEVYPYISTIHSCALKHLSNKPKLINSYWWAKSPFSLNVFESSSEYSLDDTTGGDIDVALKIWNFSRNLSAEIPAYDRAYSISPQYMQDNISLDDFTQLIGTYENHKRETRTLDYTDLLLRALESDVFLGLSHTITDESQDLTPLMWRFIKEKIEAIAIRCIRAGDPDQSICHYNGVDYETYLKTLEEGDTERNEKSYRVPSNILSKAEDWLNLDPRLRRNFKTVKGQGSIKRLKQSEPFIPESGTVAVLVRNSRSLDTISKYLRSKNQLYSGHDSFLNDEFCSKAFNLFNGLNGEYLMRDELLEALGLISEYKPDKIVDKVKSTIRKRHEKTKSHLTGLDCEFMKDLKKDPFVLFESEENKEITNIQIEALREIYSNRGVEIFKTGPRIHLSTIHAAKGGEWDHVNILSQSVIGCSDNNAYNPLEENRIKFVALTRTKEACFVIGKISNYHIYDIPPASHLYN